jgi:hypothetical protein
MNAGNNPDRFQVRYSPSGGTSTGTGAEDIGDFEVMLYERFMLPPSMEWEEIVVEVPGPGRLAIRRYVNPGGICTPNGGYLRIDTLSIAQLSEPEPPKIEIVIWSPDQNPHVISGGLVVIPQNQHVIAEPGVEIIVESDSTLQIKGQLTAHGTGAIRSTTWDNWTTVESAVRIDPARVVEAADDFGLVPAARAAWLAAPERCCGAQQEENRLV